MANRLTPPPELTDDAAELFAELAEIKPNADPGSLAILCQAYADWRQARAFIAKEGTTYVKRDKDGQVLDVREFPQVGAARKSEALYLKVTKELRLKFRPQ